MTRIVTVGAAQLGPVQLADDRASVVRRLIELLQQGATRGCDLVVFPELALTTFFPRWFLADIAAAECDPDWCAQYKETLFDFARYRRPELYGAISDAHIVD